MTSARAKPPLAVRASQEPREQFIASLAQDKLLLVALSGADEALVRGLMECPTDDGTQWFSRSEGTGTGTTLAPQMHHFDSPTPTSIPPPGFDPAALREILRTPHYVMPLRKRRESRSQDAERISVGRSHANDIVLFHPSVSKHHAYLECDDRAGLYVCDIGSTNFTYVEGRLLEQDEVAHFSIGGEVRFGSISVRVCLPETLWDALNWSGD